MRSPIYTLKKLFPAIKKTILSIVNKRLKEKDKTQYKVFRREIPIREAMLHNSVAAWAVGSRVDHSLGPFITGLEQFHVAQSAANLMSSEQQATFGQEYFKRFNPRRGTSTPDIPRKPSPVSDELGNHRILRTSRLTKVPDICCSDC